MMLPLSMRELAVRLVVSLRLLVVLVVMLLGRLDNDDHMSILALATFDRVSSFSEITGHSPGFPCRPGGPRAPAAPAPS